MPPPPFPSPTESGIMWEHFRALPRDYNSTTKAYEFEDGGRTFNEATTFPPRRWEINYTGLTYTEMLVFENFFLTMRLTQPFTFIDKWGQTWSDVRIERYERTHADHKSWVHSVAFILIKKSND